MKKDVPIFDEISLLDISGGLKYEEMETSHMNLSQICFANENFDFRST